MRREIWSQSGVCSLTCLADTAATRWRCPRPLLAGACSSPRPLPRCSIAGRHFTLPIAILAASPEEVEVVQEVFDAAQVSGVKLTPARLVADVAQLRADYARMITVPRAVLTALLADNITLILHS